MTQQYLLPPDNKEQLAALKAWLQKNGKHSLYCCWVYDGGYYDKALGCTCGLKKAKEE